MIGLPTLLSGVRLAPWVGSAQSERPNRDGPAWFCSAISDSV